MREPWNQCNMITALCQRCCEPTRLGGPPRLKYPAWVALQSPSGLGSGRRPKSEHECYRLREGWAVNLRGAAGLILPLIRAAHSRSPRRSFRPEAGEFHHLGPFRGFFGDELAEIR